MKPIKSLAVALFLVVCLASCSSKKQVAEETTSKKQALTAFEISEISTDKTYGYSPKNPVQVGGAMYSQGPSNERRYLNLLTGPNGESISYYRAGSCCPIKSKNAFIGNHVMLDNYRVTWENSKDTVSIYINMYDRGVLKAPVGFTIKK